MKTIILASLLAASPIQGMTKEPVHTSYPQSLAIHENLGGEVLEFSNQFYALKSKGTKVRIEGICVSACSMFLGLPNACVTPNASIGIHKIKGSGPFLTIATQTYLTTLPQKLHQTYASSTHRMTMIKGSRLISKGIVAPCSSRQP